MYWDALILGMLAGMLAGLLPGVHVNLASALILHASLNKDPAWLGVFIMSMAFSQSVYDYFPTASLGIPSAESILTLLPAQQLARQGKLIGVLRLSILSSLSAGMIILTLSLTTLIPHIISLLSMLFTRPAKLLILSILLILPHIPPRWDKLFILSLASMTGLISLPHAWLMPLLSGLFGMPSLIILLKEEAARLEHATQQLPLHSPTLVSSLLIASLMSFLPGVGSAYAVYLSMLIFPSTRLPERLVMVNSIASTVTYAFSIPTLYQLGRARNGAVATLKQLGMPLSMHEAILITLTSLLLASLTAYALSSVYARLISTLLARASRWIALGFIMFISLLTLSLHGLPGLVFLIACTLIGLTAVQWGTPRIILLSSLLTPVLMLLVFG